MLLQKLCYAVTLLFECFLQEGPPFAANAIDIGSVRNEDLCNCQLLETTRPTERGVASDVDVGPVVEEKADNRGVPFV